VRWSLQTNGGHRPRHVVVEIDAEHVRRDVRAFEVMSLIGRHEEQAWVRVPRWAA
jgi:hypothetical protein